MFHLVSSPGRLWLALTLPFLIPVLVAAVRLVQVPLGALPEDSLRLAAAPVALWLHAAGGMLFGLLGPVQFARVLARRLGRWHRLAGRVFVLAGGMMALGAVGMLVAVETPAVPALSATRWLGALALPLALAFGVIAARAGRRTAHRAWMIRAFAIGMGPSAVAPVMLPLYFIHGMPLIGLASDMVQIGVWVAVVALAEVVVRRGAMPSARKEVMA